MQIRCPSCETRYELASERLDDGPVRVQCTRCRAVFRAEAKARPEAAWKVRQADGEQLELDGLHTLQRWIVERRVSREDEISRTGRVWKPIGSITELSSFFAVIEQLDAASSEFSLPAVDDGLDALDAIQSPDADASTTTIEASLDGLDGLDDEADGDDLTAALLASLSQEAPARKPITSTIQPLAIEDLDSLMGEDDVEVAVSLEPVKASSTIVAFPKPGDEPEPASVLEELELASDDVPTAVVDAVDAGEDPAEIPVGTLPSGAADTEAGSGSVDEPEAEPAAAALPSIGKTGDAWLEPDDAAAPSPASPLELDEPVPPRSIAPMVMAGAIVVLVVVAVIVAVVSSDGGDAEAEAAADGSVANRDDPADSATSDGSEANDERASGDGPPGDESVPDADSAEVDADNATEPAEGAVQPAAAVAADEATTDDAAGAAPDAGDPTPANPTAANPTAGSETPVPASPIDSGEGTDGNVEGESDSSGGGGRSYAGLVKRGDKLRSSGKLDDAVLKYEAALSIRSGADAYAGMGWTYMSKGEAWRAESFFEKAIGVSASYGDAYIGLGRALQKGGKDADALEIYEDYLSRFPSGPQASIARAQAAKIRSRMKPEPEPEPEPKTPDSGDDGTASGGGTSTTDTTDDGASDRDATGDGDEGKRVIIIKKK